MVIRHCWSSLLVLIALMVSVGLNSATALADTPDTIATDPMVVVTENDTDSADLTVTLGSSVTWENQSAESIQIASKPFAGQLPYRVLLPTMLNDNSGSASSASTRSGAVGAGWPSTAIPAGERYTRTYNQPGVYPYFLSHLPTYIGTVTVVHRNKYSCRHPLCY